MEISHQGTVARHWEEGRYRLEQLLSTGGQGQLWTAIDRATGSRVALKICDAEGTEALEGEFLVANSLRHPGWAAVFDFERRGSSCGLVMEYLEGADLASFEHAYSSEEIAALAVRSLLSLRALHHRQLLHGDLTPANVHVRVSDGDPLVTTARLLDLGLSRPFHRGSARVFTGTPGHQAPEMLKGGEIDARADIYLLALTLAKLRSGEAETELALSWVEADGGTLAQWLHRLLAETKEDRPPSCDAALELGITLGALAEPDPVDRLLSPPACLTAPAAPVLVTALDRAAEKGRPIVRMSGTVASAAAVVMDHLLARSLVQGGRRFWTQGGVSPRALARELAAEGGASDAELEGIPELDRPALLRTIEAGWANSASQGVATVVLELNDEGDLRFAETLARCQPPQSLLVLLSGLPGLLSELDTDERTEQDCLHVDACGLPADEFPTWLSALLGTEVAGLGELSEALAATAVGSLPEMRRGVEALLDAGLLRVDAGGRWSLGSGRRARIASVLAGARGKAGGRALKSCRETLALACLLAGRSGRIEATARSIITHLRPRPAEIEQAVAAGWLVMLDHAALARAPHLRLEDCSEPDELAAHASRILEHEASSTLSAEVLGRLLALAERPAEAHATFSEAGMRALAKGDPTLALSLLDSAAACRPSQLSQTVEAARCDAGLARALMATGDMAAARELLETRLAGCDGASGASRSSLLSALAESHHQAGRFDHMLAAARSALDALGTRGPRKERAELHLQASRALGRLDDLPAARRELDQSTGLADQLKDAELETSILEERAALECLAGDGEAAWMLAEDARRRAEESDDRGALARALNLLCVAAWQRAQVDVALSLAEEASALHRLSGDLVREMEAESFRASLLGHGGRSEKALAAHHRVLAIARRIGEPTHEASALHHLGLHAHRRGDWDVALEHLSEAELAFKQEEDPQGRATSLRVLAALLRDRGDCEAAEQALSQAQELITEDGPLMALCQRTAASIALRQGDPGRAADLVQELLTPAGTPGDESSQGDCRRLLSEALLAKGHAQEAFREAEQAVILLRAGHGTLRALALEARAAARSLLPLDSPHAAPEEAGREGGAEARRNALVDGDLAAALRLHEQVAAPFEMARFRLTQARILISSGRALQRGQAVSVAQAALQEARTCFLRLGAGTHQAEAEQLAMELNSGDSSGGRNTDARTLSTLYDVARVLNGSLELRQVLEAALDLLLPSLDVERAAILLLNEVKVGENSPSLRVAASRNIDEETGADALSYSHTVVLDVNGRGIPLIAPDALTDPRFANCQSVARHEIRSLACVPLRSGDEIRGAVYVDDRRTLRRFTDEDSRFLQAFADLAAPAIENARLVEELREASERLAVEALDLRRQVRERFRFEGMVGESSAMERVYASIQMVADSNATVLITGENGTGKELVARAVHDAGVRKDEPFVALNCAALPETLLEAELFGIEKGTATGVTGRIGKFEHADGGTLFLDEIGDMSVGMQARLLRVLQERCFHRVGGDRNIRVDVHVIAATNVDLEKAVADKTFREDLYYRLNVVPIPVPALRERREDIPSLLEHFQAQFLKESSTPEGSSAAPFVLSDEARDMLVSHDWPGNIRQLRNLVHRLVLLHPGGRVGVEDLPQEFRGQREEMLVASAASELTMDEIKRRYAKLMLARCGGNKRLTSRTLGIAFKTLQTYLGEA